MPTFSTAARTIATMTGRLKALPHKSFAWEKLISSRPMAWTSSALSPWSAKKRFASELRATVMSVTLAYTYFFCGGKHGWRVLEKRQYLTESPMFPTNHLPLGFFFTAMCKVKAATSLSRSVSRLTCPRISCDSGHKASSVTRLCCFLYSACSFLHLASFLPSERGFLGGTPAGVRARVNKSCNASDPEVPLRRMWSKMSMCHPHFGSHALRRFQNSTWRSCSSLLCLNSIVELQWWPSWKDLSNWWHQVSLHPNDGSQLLPGHQDMCHGHHQYHHQCYPNHPGSHGVLGPCRQYKIHSLHQTETFLAEIPLLNDIPPPFGSARPLDEVPPGGKPPEVLQEQSTYLPSMALQWPLRASIPNVPPFLRRQAWDF